MLVPMLTVSIDIILIVLLRLISIFSFLLHNQGFKYLYCSAFLRVADTDPNQELGLCRLRGRSRIVGSRYCM